MSATSPDSRLLARAADIVAAHVSHNTVPEEALPGLILSVYTGLSAAGTGAPAADKRQPAVPIRKSVFPDYIISLEDGRKLKTLKRHLRTAHGITPDEYRARWGLPDGYPMVAPNYAARRSAMARRSGLGRRPSSPPIQYVPKGRRGRKVTPRAEGD